jgi:hypothetical protein
MVVLVIASVSAYRLWVLSTGPQSLTELSVQRQAVVRWLTSNDVITPGEDGSIDFASLDSELRELGVSRLELQRFDPQALVVIRPGADRQPGVAGVDDNGDAIVDNRVELGATRSDDRCEVLTPQQHEALDENTLVLQRGAFVPDAAPRSLADNTSRRVVVRGEFDGEPWSFLVHPVEPE